MSSYNVQQVWDDCLDLLKANVSKQNFDKWFNVIKLQSIEGKKATIGVPSRFVGSWVKDRFSNTIQRTIENIIKVDDMSVDFVVLEDLTGDLGTDFLLPPVQIPKKRTNLNPKYTFESFVVGSSNQFAHAAARAVAEAPAQSYNPLFIYSGVGLGKTHLLNAIGHFISQHSGKQLNILYVSSEQFTNDVINSIRCDKMVDFRNRYRNIDVLLIDDIQFLAGKERTQEEFFHIFNTLYDSHKQIVITSDKYPKEIQNIDERVRSRYEWGLLADIGPPDLETRIAILRKKADFENIPLPEDVALFIATHIKTNVRELEGALIKIGAVSSLSKKEITVEMVKDTLWYNIKDQEKTITAEDIQKTVSDHFQIKIADLKSKRRTKTLVLPRHIAMYMCREVSKLSFPEIGRCFGGKDHSTVIHACRMIEKLKETDMGTRSLIDSLTKSLKG